MSVHHQFVDVQRQA